MRATRTANLFVPEGSHRFDQMLARHQAESGRGSYEDERACHDGVVRRGVWVPLNWWEQPTSTKSAERQSARPLVASEQLKNLLSRQVGEPVHREAALVCRANLDILDVVSAPESIERRPTGSPITDRQNSCG